MPGCETRWWPGGGGSEEEEKERVMGFWSWGSGKDGSPAGKGGSRSWGETSASSSPRWQDRGEAGEDKRAPGSPSKVNYHCLWCSYFASWQSPWSSWAQLPQSAFPGEREGEVNSVEVSGMSSQSITVSRNHHHHHHHHHNHHHQQQQWQYHQGIKWSDFTKRSFTPVTQESWVRITSPVSMQLRTIKHHTIEGNTKIWQFDAPCLLLFPHPRFIQRLSSSVLGACLATSSGTGVVWTIQLAAQAGIGPL